MKRLFNDNRGAAAVEFALLAFPFLLVVFAVLEIAFMFLIDSTLDQALQRASRHVRTGTAATGNWTLATFKQDVCNEMVFSFGCSSSLLVKTTVMSDFASAKYVSPVVNGSLSVTESFSPGTSSDYMLIQVFLPWSSLLSFAGVNAHTLPDGRYVLSAASLFRNEPF